MKIEDIQNNFRIGSEVSVILRTGPQFSGTLAGISESSITLRQSSGGNIVLSAEAIDCILPAQTTELPGATTPVVQNSSVTPSTTFSPQSAPPSQTTTTYPIEVITQVVEIATRFKTAILQANIEPLPPDFSLPDSISSMLYSLTRNKMMGEWNRLENQYKNALKVRELSRLQQLIPNYEQLSEKYPELASAALFNMGCLYLDLDQAGEALKTFEQAAVHSKYPGIFYNLAAVALRKKDTAKACYALQQFFKLTSISENIRAWYQFLGLALDSGVVNVLSDWLQQALLQHRSDDARLIVESAIFVLKENDHTNDAHRLTAFLQKGNLEPDETPKLLESMLSQLDLEPTEEYNRQQQELRNAQEQAKRQKEQIKRQKEVESFLSYAVELAGRSQYAQALDAVRKALQKDPENTKAKQLEAEYLEADKERLLLTGSSPYAQAKQAKESDQDFKKAELLFREAIKKGDRAESAVKDLASLLQQQNRDKEAIQILQEYRPKAADQLRIDNMLVSIYQHAMMYPEAIKLLTNLSKSTSDYKKRANFLKQIAFCQFKGEQFDTAEKTLAQLLKLTPNDHVAKSWLDGLQQAKQTGYYASLEKIFTIKDVLEDFETTISKFLEFYLERCDYQGVNEAQIASRNFSDEDVKKLRGLIEGAGRKRPGLRAQYNLSAAKLLLDLDSEEEQQKIRSYLQDYAGDMGDSCLLEQKPQDVILSYYLEAFTIAPKWNWKLSEKVSRSLMMLYSKPLDEIIAENIPAQDCLKQAIKKGRGRPAIEWLLQLSLNSQVAEFILTLISKDKALSEKVQALCYEILGEVGEPSSDFAKFTELWGRGRDAINRRNDEIVSDLRYLESSANSLGSLPDQLDRVQELVSKLRGTLDKRRLNEVNKILDLLSNYSKQQAYVERERLADVIKNAVYDLIEQIEKSPTKYSLELFRPYLLSLGKTIEEHFTKVQQATEPEELQITLSIDSYMPDPESKVECQITISNESGKSPASAIKIQVKESPNNEYLPLRKSIDVTEALPGGQSVTCQIPVGVTDSAIASQVFTLYYQLSFTTRRGNTIQIDDTQSIKLYPETDFKEINNPYATYAQGSTVEDRNMFYGRDQLIDTLLSSIRNASSAKSLVIYGQKRAGKSSVLYHLKQQLELPIIPVSFSIGDIIDEFSVVTFLYRIIQCVEEAFEELAEQGYPSISVQRPTLNELQQNSQLRFQDYMASLRRNLKQVDEYREAKIMLLIDEFSYIYGEIRRGRVQDTFMKSWKALLEKRYFGAVLVGQDTMPQFITRFPNEFQVAESQRVSYLAEDDACRLIIEPIRIPGTKESRYKGDAVNQLLKLTAGSPYYLQIFCNRLVEYMNRKKAIYVTDADIERVKEDLISGHNSLEDAVFDNLISAGDSSIDDISKEDALAVLRDIANGSRIQSHCDRSAITANTSVPIDKVLDDLVRREVVEKQRTSLFCIRVGLFKEWLLAHQ